MSRSKIIAKVTTGILQKIDIDESTGCWNYQGYITKEGYGVSQYSLQRKIHRLRVHRVMYENMNGPIPDDLVVMHKCDNRRCCNPAHLQLGTHADNAHDKISKGRAQNYALKKHAKAIFNSKMSMEDLAEMYGVTWKSIYNIKSGKTYGRITGMKKT